MRIGIDAYLLDAGNTYRSAGVSVYARNLLCSLPRTDPEHEYLAFIGLNAPRLPTPVHSVRARFGMERPLARIPWEQAVLPVLAARHRVDLLHGLVNVLPAMHRGPMVVTVHDLSFLRVPDRLTRRRALYLDQLVRRSAGRAVRVIAVSHSTKRDLVELMHVPEERVRVIYPGVDARFRPAAPGEVMERIGAIQGRPYILHVGTLEPRKNLDVLIRAYSAVRASRGIPHALVLVGARGWMYDSLFEMVRMMRLQNDVHFVDYVPPEELPRWYNGADLFAYPSVYEGFGLPVLEAMACGVPTITSASSSLQELASEACVTVEPGSEEALAVALTNVLGDEILRARLRDAGIRRASEFSWESAARQTVETYQMVLGGR